MGFIIGRQDGKLRGMCSVAAIYSTLVGSSAALIPYAVGTFAAWGTNIYDQAISQSIRFWREISFYRGQQGDLYCKFPPLYPGKSLGRPWKSWRSNGRNVWWGLRRGAAGPHQTFASMLLLCFHCLPRLFILDIVEETYNMDHPLAFY